MMNIGLEVEKAGEEIEEEVEVEVVEVVGENQILMNLSSLMKTPQ